MVSFPLQGSARVKRLTAAFVARHSRVAAPRSHGSLIRSSVAHLLACLPPRPPHTVSHIRSAHAPMRGPHTEQIYNKTVLSRYTRRPRTNGVTARYSKGPLLLGLGIRLGFVFRVKVRIRETVRFRVRIKVRVTFASVLECTGIQNLHLAIAAPSYSGHQSNKQGHSTET